MRMPLALLVLPAALLTTPANAAPCAPTDRCAAWTTTYDDPSVAAPYRSDQFAQEVLANATTVFTVVRDVTHDTRDPYASTAAATLVATDRVTGATRWTSRRTERHYLSVQDRK